MSASFSAATDRLFAAIARSDVAEVNRALADGADVNANGPSGGETPLMRLRLCRDPTPMLRLMLQAGADPARRDLAGRSALHHLILCSDPAGVEAALAQGLDPQLRDCYGDRAFETGLYSAEPAVFARLLQAMEPLDEDDRTRLFFRHIQRGESDAALTVIARGIRLAPLTPGAFPPLYLAARAGDLRVLSALLKAGAPVDGVFGAGESALIAASRHGWPAIVAELLRQGAEPDHVDAAGQTALHVAAASRSAPPDRLAGVVRLLLASGTDALRRDREGYWPRALARACGNHGLLDLLPALDFEPAPDPSARNVESVELSNDGRLRLRWFPNDLLRPFVVEEHVQRDEWYPHRQETNDSAGAAARWLGLHGPAWFAPLIECVPSGEALSLDAVRAAAAAEAVTLRVQAFRPR